MRLSDSLRHVPCVNTVVPLQTSRCRAPRCLLQPLGERPDSFPADHPGGMAFWGQVLTGERRVSGYVLQNAGLGDT